ncbi:MAG TPA: hydrogen peroxide-dependent heme synthase [Gryllotalpicola sp.]
MNDDDKLNDRIVYTMWSVFRNRPEGWTAGPAEAAEQSEGMLRDAADSGVELRGLYRISGLRADADWMVWWHSPDITALQDAYAGLLGTAWGAASHPVWSAVGLHRPAEFNRAHIPAYLHGREPGRFLAVYPFVRSFEWYLLPEDERRRMLADHGAAARDYPDVLSNTVAAFGLGDYEWILALEAAQLHRLVDLMRGFRATEARRHVREELPFFTGERMPLRALLARLPGAPAEASARPTEL